MPKQHRTGRSIVRLAETPWTIGVTGRRHPHLEIVIDEGAASWIQDEDSSELNRIARAISASAREAHDEE